MSILMIGIIGAGLIFLTVLGINNGKEKLVDIEISGDLQLEEE